jgi:protein-S-isoprenylcysteine O-methyltransferase Ste14
VLLGFMSPDLLRMSLQLRFPLDSSVQVLGLALMGGGFFLFIWSVLARGRYSVSWDMPEDHKLVTWGPYRHVRHPSYGGYFMMFVGFCMTWLNALSLVPLVAVPGYVRLVDVEEELLVSRFGEEYRNYMDRTGRFTPRIFMRENTRRSS